MTKGRAGATRRPPRTSTSRASSRPAAEGRRGGWAHDRGVGPVRGAEGVVDIGVEAVDETVHEGGVVALLPRVEAEVLEQRHPGRQHGQAVPDGSHVETGVDRALGPPEVRARRDRRTPLREPRQGREGGPDAEVVGHHHAAAGVLGQGHVEVDAHQDPSPVELGKVLEQGEPGQGPAGGPRRRRSSSCPRRPGRLRTPPARPSRAARPGRRAGWRSPTRCRTSPAP